MTEDTVYVSDHYLRRTARKRERKLEKENPGNQYRVVKTKRGPARYQVRMVTHTNVKPPTPLRPTGRAS